MINPQDLDTIKVQREAASAMGVELEMLHIPMPESVTYGLNPQRDRDLDEICSWIEHAGRAGIRGLNYNFSVVGYQRTENRFGRGGSIYSSFEIGKYDNDELHPVGHVDLDERQANALAAGTQGPHTVLPLPAGLSAHPQRGAVSAVTPDAEEGP